MRENKVKEFLNERFGEVRVVTIKDELWFVAKDICDILGTKTKDLKTVLKGKGISNLKIQTNGGFQTMSCINKIGLHVLLSKTRKINLNTKQELYFALTGMNLEEYISISCIEAEFINRLSKALIAFNIKGIKQYSVLNNKYRIDYYIPSLNIAIEYDENNHKNYTYEEHEGRQAEIEKKLGCVFIRVNDSKSDSYNIGFVIKELLKVDKFRKELNLAS